MRRSRLKNIISKSKEFSNKQQLVGENPFDQFKNSLPEEFSSYKGDNYRLEAAWKAYGSPKNYDEAVWLGLINPLIPGKMPSIGYNEETDEYEYLNTGKENETVAKDIRVWDNDVIPLVKELKLGGYVRTFNEEKNCWTYSKNPQERIESPENNEQQVIEEFKKGGKKEAKEPDSMPVMAPKTDPLELVKLIYNSNANFAKRLIDPNRKVLDLGNNIIGTHKLGYIEEDGKFYVFPSIREINGELVDLSNEDVGKAWSDAKAAGDYIEFPSRADADWFTADNYKAYFPGLEKYAPGKYKNGGQMNVIPEGALHARKNNMELAKEGEVTHKGIPVIDNQGEQQAEIERNEIIFTKDTTDKIECFYKKFKDDSTSSAEKDELAIKCGKFLVKQILENTDDKTGLIKEISQKSI